MMATAHAVGNAANTEAVERSALLSSSDSELPASSRDGLADPNETTPLFRTTNRPRVLSAFLDKNTGLLLVAASQIFFSGANISVKWLNSLDEPIPMLELIWVRMTITYVGSVAYMYWRKIPDPLLGPQGVRGLLVLRGFAGFVTLSGMYSSLQHLSLSDATVLTFIAPTLTGFSAALFLKEPISLKQLFSGLCSFLGVVLIARPESLFGHPKRDSSEVATPKQRMLSVSAGLLGVLGATCTYTLLRAIGKRAHPLHSLVFFSVICVLTSTISMVIFRISPVIPTDTSLLSMLFLIGILGLVAQTLLVMGLQRETASRGSLMSYTSIVFAVAFEFIILRTMPSALSITGAVIIMSSAIYISLAKENTSEPIMGPTLDRPPLTHPVDDSHPRP